MRAVTSLSVTAVTVFLLVCQYLQYHWYQAFFPAQIVFCVFLVVFAAWTLASEWFGVDDYRSSVTGKDDLNTRILRHGGIFPFYGWLLQVFLTIVYLGIFYYGRGGSALRYVLSGALPWIFVEILVAIVVIALQVGNYSANRRTAELQDMHESGISQRDQFASSLEALCERCSGRADLQHLVDVLNVQSESLPIRLSNKGLEKRARAGQLISVLNNTETAQIQPEQLRELSSVLKGMK